jgi:hypothetical protein
MKETIKAAEIIDFFATLMMAIITDAASGLNSIFGDWNSH